MARAVETFCLWRADALVVLGVSGGPDSTAMLAAVLALPPNLRPRVLVAHLDHGLRAEAGAEAEAVRALAGRFGVPCRTARADLAAVAGGGRSPEAEARRVRYRFLAETARACGAAIVAVGHHQDDQAETVLLNLARGAGVRGLAGMRPFRPLQISDFTGSLVRPLWYARRADVLAFLAQEGLAFAEDPTNRDTGRPRNAIRHVVLPSLERALGTGVRANLARSAEHLAAAGEALDRWAREVAASCREGPVLRRIPGWNALPEAIRHWVVAAWWEELTRGAPLRSRHIRALLDALGDGAATHRRLDLPDGWVAAVAPAGLTLLRPTGTAGWRVPVPVPGRVPVPGLGEVTACLSPWPVPPGERAAAIGDAAGVALPLGLRPPRAGERLRPRGGPHARPLRELLREAGIPPPERRGPCVLEDANGRVLWVVGGRAAWDFGVGAGTRQVLIVRFRSATDASLS